MTWSEERRARHSAAMKARWADKQARDKLLEGLNKPEVRARLSEAARAKGSPSQESREKNRQSQLARWANDDEARAKMGEAARAMWADPERRAAAQESLDRAMRDPEARRKMSEARKRYLEANPDKHVAPWVDPPEWAVPLIEKWKLVRLLRQQDGDLCQLCLHPIDFSLEYPHREYVNVDHIRPWASGGTNDPDNLWLTHFKCNMSKGARHVGRQDGSTDRRNTAHQEAAGDHGDVPRG